MRLCNLRNAAHEARFQADRFAGGDDRGPSQSNRIVKAVVILATGFCAMNPAAGLAAQPAQYGPPAPVRAQVVASNNQAQGAPSAIPVALHEIALTVTAQHPQIKSAIGQMRAAGYDVKGAKWLRFPSVTVEALATSRGSVNAAQDGTVLNAVVEQPIWSGGRISAAIDRAKAQLQVQERALDEVARDLSLRAIQAYFDVAQAALRIEVLERTLAQNREFLETISRRVEQQISPQSDLSLARARAAQTEQQLALARAQRRSGLNTLYELTGDPSFDLGYVERYDPARHHPDLNGAVDLALACDPRSARLSALAIVAQADQRAAKAALLPQLLGQVSSNEVLGERIGLALRAQSGNGLSQAAAAQGARERSLAAQEGIAAAQRELREALRLDFVNNAAARERLASAGTAAESASDVTDSFRRQFIAGKRTWLDVMNALQESMNTQLAEIDLQVTAQLTSARIALRTCAWQPRAPLDDVDPRNDNK